MVQRVCLPRALCVMRLCMRTYTGHAIPWVILERLHASHTWHDCLFTIHTLTITGKSVV